MAYGDWGSYFNLPKTTTTPRATLTGQKTPYQRDLWKNPFSQNSYAGMSQPIANPYNFTDDQKYYYNEEGAGSKAAYNMFLQGLNASPMAKQYLQNQYSDLFSNYSAQVAGSPSYTWLQYLENLNPQALYRQVTPRMRGETPSAYLPRFRYVR
jgi:hypothetical protein